MVKLFVLADDTTGALDCGAQFKAGGAQVEIFLCDTFSFDNVDSDVDVVVVNTETRHKAPDEAKEVVRRLSRLAIRHGVPYFYKKTDSALRGNVGSELEGVLEGTGAGTLYFIPAFPALSRTTVGGVQYIDGVPLSQSVFRNDPFEPAVHSEIERILREQTDLPIALVPKGGAPTSGDARTIFVFDAETNDDLERLSIAVRNIPEARVFAGCAGFAAYLPKMLQMEGGSPLPRMDYAGLLAVSATLSEAAEEHFRHAEEAGFTILRFAVKEILDAPIGSEASAQLSRVILERFRESGRLIVTVERTLAAEGSVRAASRRITDHLGGIVRNIFEAGFRGALLATGGDTLHGILHALGCTKIRPELELETGVELSQAVIWNGSIRLITKAGSFGSPGVYPHADDFLRALSGELSPLEHE